MVFFFYILEDLLLAEQGKIIQSLNLDFTFLIYIYLVEDVYTVCWIILPLHRGITYLYKQEIIGTSVALIWLFNQSQMQSGEVNAITPRSRGGI